MKSEVKQKFNNNDGNRGEIVIYQSEDGLARIKVKMQDETVWLTQAQLRLISVSISNIFLRRVSWTQGQLFGNSEQLRVMVKHIASHIIILI